jgi:hypothetical protein
MYRASIFDCDRHRVRQWAALRKLFGLWRGTSKPVFDRTNREKVLVNYVRQTQIKAGILVP